MKLIIAGIGPGKPELITLEALNHARTADIIIIPRSSGTAGMAENIITQFIPDAKMIHITFPMTYDTIERDNAILSQLEALRSEWEGMQKVFFPVIGDCMLYSTGKYLLEAFRKIVDIEVEFVPGISVHSLVSAKTGKFLAMGDEVFTVVSGTAGAERVREVMGCSDVVAVYKAIAVDDWEMMEGLEIVTGQRVGTEKERIIMGEVGCLDDYMSVVLAWKR